MFDQALLLQHLPKDYIHIQQALQKRAWQQLKDANHALLGALLYCDIPPLKTLCLAVNHADDDTLVSCTEKLLRAMLDLMGGVL